MVGATVRAGYDATSPGQLVTWGYRVIALSRGHKVAFSRAPRRKLPRHFAWGFDSRKLLKQVCSVIAN